jgi:hypothetical protein
MNWKAATDEQLLQILLHEDCPIMYYKYFALRELKRRKNKND